MARVNVYLPDDLAEEARAAGVNVSNVTQAALRHELARRSTSDWLRQLGPTEPRVATHEEVLAALDESRDELGDRFG
jgi:post-segregation antitoxin (ccd killing protein)